MQSVEVEYEPFRKSGEWEQLCDRVGAPPFLRPYWNLAWWTQFGTDEPAVIAVRRDGRLAGLLSVRFQSGAVRSTTNEHTPGFGLVAEDVDAARAVTNALFALTPTRATLAFLDEDVELPLWQEAADAAGYRWGARTLLRSPYLDIATEWEAYEASLASAFRSEIRRRRRRLEERGKLELDVIAGGTGLDRLLDEGFAVEGSGWKQLGGTAIESSPRTAAFYRSLAHAAAERGSLRLAFLRLDGKPTAFALGLEENRVYYMIKSGYDPALRSLAPGIILRYELVARAFAERLTRFEFLGADDAWKLVFTSTTRTRVQFSAFRRSARGFVEWAATSHARPLARRLHLGDLRRLRARRRFR